MAAIVRLLLFAFLFTAPLFSLGSRNGFTINGRVKIPQGFATKGFALPGRMSNVKVILNGGQNVTYSLWIVPDSNTRKPNVFFEERVLAPIRHRWAEVQEQQVFCSPRAGHNNETWKMGWTFEVSGNSSSYATGSTCRTTFITFKELMFKGCNASFTRTDREIAGGSRPYTNLKGDAGGGMALMLHILLVGCNGSKLSGYGISISYNVPSGTHLIEVVVMGYFFSPVRVDVSARNPGKVHAALTENRRGLNELVLEPLREEQYYEVREPFSVMSLLKSPMGLMLGFMLVVAFLMPKFVENMDPEEMRGAHEEMRGQGAPSLSTSLPRGARN
ncbi:ER membrane protein complex subunit 7-like protein [Hibiscus syriacus]|uniref:ER membrane protein complex subunit 7-like protein n=1 Tax=Hibiscus syriacus TaxID=106335 RepID=A0A6A2WH64_HIBSY|nr:ER membrane protein complex subunit 7-like protein [Hibiscus syriacus]